MGVPTMDIHTPTTSIKNSSGALDMAPSLQELMKVKKNIESELTELLDVLDSHKVDMNTPLVTADGFPRSDIDVAQVRITRSRIIRLRNDLKQNLNEIEKELHLHYQSASGESSLASDKNDKDSKTMEQTEKVVVPFAVVNKVAPMSPAQDAGLREGDKIVEFGHLHAGNHEKLTRLANVVQANLNRTIELVVLRGEEQLSLKLVPKTGWGGRGAMGCHILPL